MGHGVRAALVAAILRALVEDLRGCATEPAKFLHSPMGQNLLKCGKSSGGLPRQEVGGSVFKVYNQGVALMHAKNFAAAQIKFEPAIRDNPNFAEAHNNLGFTLRQQGPQNYSKALEHYNKAIQLKPAMAEAYENRGVLFAKMGRKAAAEKDLVTLKKLNPKLAGELEAFLKTGKEEEEYGPTSPVRKRFGPR